MSVSDTAFVVSRWVEILGGQYFSPCLSLSLPLSLPLSLSPFSLLLFLSLCFCFYSFSLSLAFFQPVRLVASVTSSSNLVYVVRVGRS